MGDADNEKACQCGNSTAYDSSIDWETPEDAQRLLAGPQMELKPNQRTGHASATDRHWAEKHWSGKAKP
jgi:hypothetical protein